MTTAQAISASTVSVLVLGSLALLFYIGQTWDFVIFKRSAVNLKRKAVVMLKEMQQKSIIQVIIYGVGIWLLLPLLQLGIFFSETISTDFAEILRIMFYAVGFLNIIVSMFLFAFLTFNMMIWLGIDVVKVFKLDKKKC